MVSELATRLSKSPAWLNDRLGLVKLPEAVASLVDEGKINLSNAYALAKLATVAIEEVPAYVDRSMTMTPQEFVPTLSARIKEIRDAKRQGRDSTPQDFIPVEHLRKIAELKSEMREPKIGPVLVHSNKIKTASEGFNLGVRWALHMDPESIEIAKQKETDRKTKLKEEQEKRKEERQKKKQEEATKTSAALVFPK